MKENIRDIDEPLNKVISLHGVYFNYNTDKLYEKYSEEAKNELAKRHPENDIGFIAQEVMEVLPELVEKDTTTDLYTVNYVSMIPLLVEAMKEQHKIIDSLAYEISIIKSGSASSLKSLILTSDENLNLQLCN